MKRMRVIALQLRVTADALFNTVKPQTAKLRIRAETFYHTSPGEITEINRVGLFGTFLFFSLDPGEHSWTHNKNEKIYKIEVPGNQIIEAKRMFYLHSLDEVKGIIEEVSLLLNVDIDDAPDYLSEYKSVWDLPMDTDAYADKAWEMQRLTAEAAKALGYRGVEVTDEYGSSWMIDMEGKLDELVDITDEVLNGTYSKLT